MEHVTCPCGQVFVAELWSVVNVVTDPGIKDMLLGGELNIVRCPHCGLIFHVEHFLLYHDSSKEIMAFVYPSSFRSKEAYWRKKMHEQYATAQEDLSGEDKLNYEPMLVFGLEQLQDLIKEDEEVEDEIRIVDYECSKKNLKTISLKRSVARKNKIPRLLPVNEGNLRLGSVIAAVEKIIKSNPYLEHYEDFLKKLNALTENEFEKILA